MLLWLRLAGWSWLKLRQSRLSDVALILGGSGLGGVGPSPFPTPFCFLDLSVAASGSGTVTLDEGTLDEDLVKDLVVLDEDSVTLRNDLVALCDDL